MICSSNSRKFIYMVRIDKYNEDEKYIIHNCYYFRNHIKSCIKVTKLIIGERLYGITPRAIVTY